VPRVDDAEAWEIEDRYERHKVDRARYAAAMGIAIGEAAERIAAQVEKIRERRTFSLYKSDISTYKAASNGTLKGNERGTLSGVDP